MFLVGFRLPGNSQGTCALVVVMCAPSLRSEAKQPRDHTKPVVELNGVARSDAPFLVGFVVFSLVLRVV